MIEKLLEDVRTLLVEVNLENLTPADAYTIQTLLMMIDSGVIAKIVNNETNKEETI